MHCHILLNHHFWREFQISGESGSNFHHLRYTNGISEHPVVFYSIIFYMVIFLVVTNLPHYFFGIVARWDPTTGHSTVFRNDLYPSPSSFFSVGPPLGGTPAPKTHRINYVLGSTGVLSIQ